MDKYYSSLGPFFNADPLLLFDFIYLCPEHDYQSLFGKIPAPLSLNLLMFSAKLPTLMNDVSTYLSTYNHTSTIMSALGPKMEFLAGVDKKEN